MARSGGDKDGQSGMGRGGNGLPEFNPFENPE